MAQTRWCQAFLALALFLLAFSPVFVSPPSVSPAWAAEGGSIEEARRLIDELGRRGIEVLADPEMDEAGRKAEFKDFFLTYFDVDGLSRFCLGRYWRRAEARELEEYRSLFERFIVDAYAARLSAYTGETLSIHAVRSLNDGGYLVESLVRKQGDGAPIKVDWRLETRKGKLLIIDVMIEGVSMAITHRADFTSVITREGGKVGALLDALRKKLAGG